MTMERFRYRILWRTTRDIVEYDALRQGQVDIDGRVWCGDSDLLSDNYGYWRYPVIVPYVVDSFGRWVASPWPPPSDVPRLTSDKG